jgi:DNA-binding transcriptional LysR family regulator
VTRAAARLGTSQPATSRALARLREMFDDPLLVRSAGAFQLTEQARELLPRLEDALRSVRELTRPARFEPRLATGVIRIAAPDIVSYMLVPPLLQRLAALAPGVDLEVVQWQQDWRLHLERGEIDVTIGFPTGTEHNIYAHPLFEFDWAVLLRKGHPALRRKWTPATYASLDHVLVSLTGRGGGPLDDVLAAHDLKRRIALRVPYPLLAPFLAPGSDLAVTTVRWLALRVAAIAGLVVRRPPFAAPRVRVPMVWHERAQRDPRQRWVRRQLVEVAAEIPATTLRW